MALSSPPLAVLADIIEVPELAQMDEETAVWNRRDEIFSITQSRLLMSLQVAGRPVSPGLVIILTLWAVALFFAFGIFAKSNALVIAAMASGAACIAFALFLILELGLPYTGVFRVSPAALQEAIDTSANRARSGGAPLARRSDRAEFRLDAATSKRCRKSPAGGCAA